MIACNTIHLLVSLTIFSNIKFAVSISCYQCNSTSLIDQFQCTEMMDNSNLSPKPCTDVYNAAYCVKLTGRYEGGLGVKRYCSSHHLGNYCNYVKQPGDTKEYRTCVYTCDSDGCNGADQVKLFSCLMSIPIMLLSRWFLF